MTREQWAKLSNEEKNNKIAELSPPTTERHCSNCGRACAGAEYDDLDPCDEWSKQEKA